MGTMMIKSLSLLLTLTATLLAAGTRAQTVPGDILRGKGNYLQGRRLVQPEYRAGLGRINVETWKASNREAQRLYRDYMMGRARHINYKRGLTGKLQDELQRKMEEDQRRWRESPTPDDIASGDALNALAGDLADPSIPPRPGSPRGSTCRRASPSPPWRSRSPTPRNRRSSSARWPSTGCSSRTARGQLAAPLPPPRGRSRRAATRRRSRGSSPSAARGSSPRRPITRDSGSGRGARQKGWKIAVLTGDNQSGPSLPRLRPPPRRGHPDLRRAGVRRAADPRRQRAQGVDRGGAAGLHAARPAPLLRPRQLALGGVALRGPRPPPGPAEGRARDRDRDRDRRPGDSATPPGGR